MASCVDVDGDAAEGGGGCGRLKSGHGGGRGAARRACGWSARQHPFHPAEQPRADAAVAQRVDHAPAAPAADVGLRKDDFATVDVPRYFIDAARAGVPYYLAALSSIELNSAATKFRVRYYRNGSHAGFILYATDDKIDEAGWALVKQELRKAKGGGNFNNLLLRAPNGNPEGVKLIPIAEVGAKDEFLNIKGVSAEDMMTAHRVPPALMGIVPKATSGLGDAITAAKVFARNEVASLQQTFLDVNDRLGIEVFRFDEYVVERSDAAA